MRGKYPDHDHRVKDTKQRLGAFRISNESLTTCSRAHCCHEEPCRIKREINHLSIEACLALFERNNCHFEANIADRTKRSCIM